MRLKKGSKVEVLTQKDVPSGSWRCAEIIGGGDQNYMVKYDGDVESFGKVMIERVPRKAIRPCPPLINVFEDWMVGDVVEVFHNFSWKMATVLKVSRHNNVLVRLLGSAIEFKASKYDVRARLCWQDGEWMVIGKVSSKCEDLRFKLPSTRHVDNQLQKMDTDGIRCINGDHVFTRNIHNATGSQVIASRTRKRKQPDCQLKVEAYPGCNQRRRVGEKGSSRCHYYASQQPQLPEKVDDAVCSRELLGEKYMHPSFVNKVTGCSDLISEREKTGGGIGCSRTVNLESDDVGSVSSSVASCSAHDNYSHRLHRVYNTGSSKGNESQFNDAESFCPLESGEGAFLLPAKEELTEEIHRIELHAYRNIIEALHASGPLSWEQELLLTNLRDSLHISTDEHLMLIRKLVSYRCLHAL